MIGIKYIEPRYSVDHDNIPNQGKEKPVTHERPLKSRESRCAAKGSKDIAKGIKARRTQNNGSERKAGGIGTA